MKKKSILLASEIKRVFSNYFGKDLYVVSQNYLQE